LQINGVKFSSQTLTTISCYDVGQFTVGNVATNGPLADAQLQRDFFDCQQPFVVIGRCW
jgi:hypothetical protein